MAYVGKTQEAMTIQNDQMSDADFQQFLEDAFSLADSFLKSGGAFYIWHADSQGLAFREAAKAVGWQVRQCLVWVKNTLVLGRQDYQWKHEPCLYGWKDGGAHIWANDRSQTTVLEFNKPQASRDHPTTKPVDLFSYQLCNNTHEGDVVLDVFSGSGTTILACEQSNRVVRVMELEPRYVDVAVRRWQELTGQEARLEATGETFNELKAKRVSS